MLLISGDTMLSSEDCVASSSALRNVYDVLLVAPVELNLIILALVDVGEFWLTK